MREDVGIVGIKLEGTVHVAGGLVKLTTIHRDSPKDELNERVSIVEFGRAPRVLKGQPLLFIPELPGLAAPVVEVRQGHSGVAPGVSGIQGNSAFEENARFRIILRSAPAYAVHSTKPAVVNLEAGQRFSTRQTK